jgi:adenylate cyclase
VGSVRIAYDLWGTTVNLASRCESYCVPNECTIAPSTAELVRNDSRFIVTPLDGTMILKGIGEVQLHTVRKSE